MADRKTRLVEVNGNLNDQGYINQILRTAAIPFTLQQDNVRPHTARVTTIPVAKQLKRPAMASPDLNKIELMRDILGRRVHVTFNDISVIYVTS